MTAAATGCSQPETLSEAMRAWFAVLHCAPITRYHHGVHAHGLQEYFRKRPVSDFAGPAGSELVFKYARDEMGARDRGLREAFGGPGNLAPRISYAFLRQRLCTLRHVLECAFQRGTLASMPTPWPIPRPGGQGHANARKYLLASAREAAIRREPPPMHRAPVNVSKSEIPIGPLPLGGVTLGQAMNGFLQTGMRRATPATRTARIDHVRWLCHFFGADRPLSEFEGASGYRLLSEYVAKEGTDPGGRGIRFVTLKKRLGTLRMAFTEAAKSGHLKALPFFPDLPRDSKPRERYLKLDEYRGILAAISPPWDLWVTIGVWSGMHSSDIDSMTWAMVDLGAGPGNGPGPGPAHWLRRNTKNKKTPAWLPMPDELREALTAAYRTAPPTNPNQMIVGACRNIRRHLKRACRKLGIPRVSPIDLRRTCATWWIERGGPIDGLRKWLGHSVTSEMIQRHYSQVTPAMVNGGVDALNRAARDPGSASPPGPQTGPRLLQASPPSLPIDVEGMV